MSFVWMERHNDGTVFIASSAEKVQRASTKYRKENSTKICEARVVRDGVVKTDEASIEDFEEVQG